MRSKEKTAIIRVDDDLQAEELVLMSNARLLEARDYYHRS